MIRTVVIDDEKLIRQSTIHKLKTHFSSSIEVVGEASGVIDSVKLINDLEPDALFLDIQIKNGTGFDVLEMIKQKNIQVIFVTAYSEYGIKALKFGAIDYLLKPFDLDELRIAITKLKANQLVVNKEQVAVSKQQIENHSDPTIVIKTVSTLYLIKLDDIVYLQSDGSYCTFFLVNTNKILSSKGLKFYEDSLPSSQFIRTHQSYVANKKYVNKFYKDGYLEVHNGKQLPVSVRRREEVRKFLKN